MSMSLLFTAALLTLAQAQDCPKVDLITDFDLASYAQGAWYEIARYNNSVEKYASCLVSNYTKKGDNEYVIEVSEVQDGKRIVYNGLVDVSTDEHHKGNITYIFLDKSRKIRFNMIFLAVDYSSYALKYSCQIDPNTKSLLVYSWIYSRTMTLTDSAKAAIDKYLSTSKLLDKNKFFWDAFSDDACKYTDSSIDHTLPSRFATE